MHNQREKSRNGDSVRNVATRVDDEDEFEHEIIEVRASHASGLEVNADRSRNEDIQLENGDYNAGVPAAVVQEVVEKGEGNDVQAVLWGRETLRWMDLNTVKCAMKSRRANWRGILCSLTLIDAQTT